MIWLLVFYLPVLLIFLAACRRRGGLLTPDVLFVLLNTVALLGTVLVVNPVSAEESRYAWLVLLGTSVFATVATVVRLTFPRTPIENTAVVTPVIPNASLWGLYGVSLLVCIGYYVAVGHVTLLDALSANSHGSSYDSASARLASYAGSRYFFPGYVNQFKNSILPLVTMAVVHSLWARRRPGRLPASIVLLGVMLVMVAGTGQRGATVLVFLIGLVAAYKARLLSGAKILAASAVGFAVFSLLTMALQRNAAQLASANGFWPRMSVFGQALWSRVVLENPASGVAAFHYTERLPTPWGRQWLSDMMGVLPGNRGSDLANRVFQMLYGTARGTAPETIWGGIYYNFQTVGLVLVPALLAIAMALTTRRLYQPRSESDGPQNMLTVLSLSGMAVSLGSWVAGSPMTILNTGFFAYVALWWFSRRLRGHRLEAQPPPSARPSSALQGDTPVPKSAQRLQSAGASR